MRSRGIHPSMPATAAGILARTRGGDVADLPNCMQALTRGGDVADLPNCIHSSMPATADSAIHVVSKAQPRRLKSLPSVTDSDAREEFQIRSFTELNSSPANDLRISCREAVSPDGAGFSVAHVGEVLLVRCLVVLNMNLGGLSGAACINRSLRNATDVRDRAVTYI